jgi:hypothetical protein
MFRLARLIRRLLLLAVLGTMAWGAWDLWGPVRSSLRRFDPDAVAQLETEMWRAYYDKRPVPLFLEMGELLRTQYHLPYLRSELTAFDAARAAFVFKRGHDRSDYERALPALDRYYRRIRAVSDRLRHPAGDLDRALAEIQGEIYGQPIGDFAEHARLRAEAMVLRDDEAAAGGVTPDDWRRIETLLQGSWRALHQAVARG